MINLADQEQIAYKTIFLWNKRASYIRFPVYKKRPIVMYSAKMLRLGCVIPRHGSLWPRGGGVHAT